MEYDKLLVLYLVIRDVLGVVELRLDKVVGLSMGDCTKYRRPRIDCRHRRRLNNRVKGQGKVDKDKGTDTDTDKGKGVDKDKDKDGGVGKNDDEKEIHD